MHKLPLLEWTDTAESPVFDQFFEAYEKAFVLPDEMEDREGFAECLRLNHGDAYNAIVSRYGPFRELCCIARDPETGDLIGGANFIAMPHDMADKSIVTANLNYIYVDAAMRGRGWFRPLVEAVRAGIVGLFGDRDECLVFIEQNDPVLMADKAYAQDSRMSGLDQFDRLRIWARLGAKVVDFPYVQPPLSAAQAPDGNLIYSVLGAKGARLDPAILRRHLRIFFGVSVLKGSDLESIPSATLQLTGLGRMTNEGQELALFDPRPALERLNPLEQAALRSGARRSFLTWLASVV